MSLINRGKKEKKKEEEVRQEDILRLNNSKSGVWGEEAWEHTHTCFLPLKCVLKVVNTAVPISIAPFDLKRSTIET